MLSFTALEVNPTITTYAAEKHGNVKKVHEFAFSFRPTSKFQVSQVLRVQHVGGQYADVSCRRQHETAWDSF